MIEPEPPQPQSPQPRRPFQFSLGTLLLIMMLTSVLAAALAGLLQLGDSRLPRGFFVLMVIAAPMAVMILLSLLRSVAGLFDRSRRR